MLKVLNRLHIPPSSDSTFPNRAGTGLDSKLGKLAFHASRNVGGRCTRVFVYFLVSDAEANMG